MKCSKCGTYYEGDKCPACEGNKEKAKEVIETNYKKTNYLFIILISIIIIVVGGSFLICEISKPSPKEELQSTLIALTQEAVESKLKAPSTASFPWGHDSYVIRQNGDIYTITSYVDAENSYGAKIRNTFTVQLECDIDAKEYKINNIDIK